jgi:hypothetical protein
VGDDFTLPADVKAADANLPARLQDTALNATYAPVSGSSIYAPKVSPAFTGTPTLNGQPIGTASFKVTEDPNEAFDPGQLLVVVEPPAPWTLADLGFSMLWQASSLALGDGAQITSWADSSGNAHTLTKISTNGPTLDLDGFGGKPAAIFTGAQYLDTAAFTAMTDRVTLVVIGQTTSTVNSESFVDSTTAPDRVALFKSYNAGSPTFRMERGAIGGQSVATTNADFNDLPHVFIASFNGTSEVSRLYIDGVAKGNGVSPMGTSNSFSTIRVGARSDAGNMLDGKIAAVGVLNRTLTGPEIAQIQTYAAATWGI